MRRNRVFIVLLVIVTVLAMATTALAGKPDNPGKPPPPPDIWTCAERVENGAVWLPGRWEVDYYVSDVSNLENQVDVDVPLCIDLDHLPTHKYVEKWTVEWEGRAVRKAPNGLMFIFEEEVHTTHYADLEVSPGCVFVEETGLYTCSGEVEMTLKGNDQVAKHLVFLAMGRQGDKWTELTFKVTPDL